MPEFAYLMASMHFVVVFLPLISATTAIIAWPGQAIIDYLLMMPLCSSSPSYWPVVVCLASSPFCLAQMGLEQELAS